MLLIDGQWYYLPDGKPVQAHVVGGAPEWFLLTDPHGMTCYGVYTFGLRQFVYDRELGDFRGITCELTLTDLQPAESNAAALWRSRTAATHVRHVRARRHVGP